MKNNIINTCIISTFLLFCSCTSNTIVQPINIPVKAAVTSPGITAPLSEPVVSADALSILSRKEIPILCYHQLREWRTKDSKVARDYIVPVNTFREQLKMLADSGYQSILPDQLNAYLATGATVPDKAMMLTFDDTDFSQFDIAYPEMKRYGFKGVFFIMTVSIGRPGYMTKEQIKKLSDDGHVIGLHTWDHQNVKKYTASDWTTQIDKPQQQLQLITGKPVQYFAYPFGLWNESAIPELKKRGLSLAFQLSTKRDQNDPLYTIRRIIIPGSWNPASMHSAIRRSFQNKI